MHELLRLKKWAKRLRAPDEEIEDLAMTAYLRGLECGVPEWFFTSVCLKHLVLTQRRNARRRATVWLDDEEAVEIRKLYTKPAQEIGLLYNLTMRFIFTLKEQYRDVLLLAARDFTADEMAEALSLPKKDIYWHLQRGRKLLRDRGLYEVTAGASLYVGVRRESRKWNANILVGDRRVYLGSFKTEKEAAKAYEEAAANIGRNVRRKKGSAFLPRTKAAAVERAEQGNAVVRVGAP